MKEKVLEIFRSLDEEKIKKLNDIEYIFERGIVKNRLSEELLKILSCGHVLALIDVTANKESVEDMLAELSRAKYKITIKYCLVSGLSSDIVLCEEESKDVKNILDEVSEDVRMAVVLGGSELLAYSQYHFKSRGVKTVFIMNEATYDPFDTKKCIKENKKLISFPSQVADLTVIDSAVIYGGGKNENLFSMSMCMSCGYYLLECYFLYAKRRRFPLRLLTALEDEYIEVMKSLNGSTGREISEKLLRLLVVFSLARNVTGTTELNVGGHLLAALTAQCVELEAENFAVLICIVLKNYYLRLNKICGLFFPQNRVNNQKFLQKNLEIEENSLRGANRQIDFGYENYVMVSEAKELLKRVMTLDKINPMENLKSFSADKGYSMKKISVIKYLDYIKAAMETISDGTLLKNLYIKGLV